MREKENLTLLGNQQNNYETDYNPGLLETFVNKHPEYNVIVLDKNSKSTLYIGDYMQGEAYRSESYILKNSEL